jgi:hypothetical protein
MSHFLPFFSLTPLITQKTDFKKRLLRGESVEHKMKKMKCLGASEIPKVSYLENALISASCLHCFVTLKSFSLLFADINVEVSGKNHLSHSLCRSNLSPVTLKVAAAIEDKMCT